MFLSGSQWTRVELTYPTAFRANEQRSERTPQMESVVAAFDRLKKW